MKIKPEHYELLRDYLTPLLVKHHKAAWKGYQLAGLSLKRYSWDLLRLSGLDICPWYSYLDDTHLDTALAKVVNTFIAKQEVAP